MNANTHKMRHWLTAFLLLFCLQASAEPVDFELPDLDGKRYKLSDYRGKWVVVNFWAAWCEPCRREIPELVAFQQANPQHQVLSINFEDIAPVHAKAFAKETGMNYPVLRIGATPIYPFEPLKGLPTTAIVNPQGEMVANHAGPVSREMIEEFIAKESVSRP